MGGTAGPCLLELIFSPRDFPGMRPNDRGRRTAMAHGLGAPEVDLDVCGPGRRGVMWGLPLSLAFAKAASRVGIVDIAEATRRGRPRRNAVLEMGRELLAELIPTVASS